MLLGVRHRKQASRGGSSRERLYRANQLDPSDCDQDREQACASDFAGKTLRSVFMQNKESTAWRGGGGICKPGAGPRS